MATSSSTASNVPLWNSKTEGHGGAFLAMQDGGNLVASGTNGK
jgi:hypothetical protein